MNEEKLDGIAKILGGRLTLLTLKEDRRYSKRPQGYESEARRAEEMIRRGIEEVNGTDQFPVIRCVECARPVDASPHSGNYQRVSGWAKLRTQGGTNEVSLKVEYPEFMCRDCMRLLRSGLAPQVGLFEEDQL